jgi:hypothetical protein
MFHFHWKLIIFGTNNNGNTDVMCEKIEQSPMTKTLTIITLFFATISFGQVTKENPYKNINGLMSVDSISWQDIVDGFSMSDRFGGYIYQLDSDMTFQKIDFDCVVRFKVDSGSWEIKNHNTVVLKSNKQILYFDVVKFDQFYFFILPTQRQAFITDLKSARIKLKNFKSGIRNSRTYTADYLIGYGLGKKYYVKVIEDNTGT